MSTQVFQNARIIDPSRQMDEIGTMIVQDGVIVASGADASNQGIPNDAEVHNLSGLVIMPGLVDTRVHIGEPGEEHRETIASASKAAANGGITTILTQPDTNPVVDDVALVEHIRRTAREDSDIHVIPAGAITKGFDGKTLTEMGSMSAAGAKSFSEGRNTIKDAQTMRRALTYARDFDALIAVETQDAALSGNGVMNEGLFASWLGLPGIPREAELIPLERDFALAKLTGGQYHAAKISNALSCEAAQRAKQSADNISIGASINHLSLNENDIGQYRTYFRLNPPLRAEDDRLAMIAALNDGTIDLLSSSHDPQDADNKRRPFAEAISGAIGLETLLSAALRLYHSGDVPLLRLVEVLSTAPARLFSLPGGTLKPQSAADFIIVDLDRPWLVEEASILSKCKNTCFENARMQGRTIKTFVNGQMIYNVEDHENA